MDAEAGEEAVPRWAACAWHWGGGGVEGLRCPPTPHRLCAYGRRVISPPPPPTRPCRRGYGFARLHAGSAPLLHAALPRGSCASGTSHPGRGGGRGSTAGVFASRVRRAALTDTGMSGELLACDKCVPIGKRCHAAGRSPPPMRAPHGVCALQQALRQLRVAPRKAEHPAVDCWEQGVSSRRPGRPWGLAALAVKFVHTNCAGGSKQKRKLCCGAHSVHAGQGGGGRPTIRSCLCVHPSVAGLQRRAHSLQGLLHAGA